MKEFLKWLGVNEKIGKLIIWIMIIMGFLILTNAMLDSIGFPHYQITYQNLKRINVSKTFNYMANILMTLLSFYCIVFLIFDIKGIKKIFKYSLLYLLLNFIMTQLTNSAITHIFIIGYILLFSYFYSNKQKKYVLYMLFSFIFNTFIQGIMYQYKISYINYANLGELTKFFLGLDYFIIMTIIIIVKEVISKKRGDFKWLTMADQQHAGSGLETSKKKQN